MTSRSRVSGHGVRPAAAKTFSAADPHGTSGAQRATVRSGSVRSCSPVTSAGLPAGTTSCSRLRTNTVGSPAARSASTTVAIVVGLAAANTSAGAPDDDLLGEPRAPPKLNVTVTSGCSAMKVSPSSVKVSVSDAAASTTRSPDSSPCAAVRPEDDDPPQPASGQQGCQHGGGEDGTPVHGWPLGSAPAGSSTTTLVALTLATATTPTSRPSSSAASRLISETIRNGPACISTCAITVSRTT